MAVVVSDSTNAAYDTKLSKANGFYRAEAYNLGGTGSGYLALTSNQVFNVTFANAGNSKGVIVCLYGLNTTADRSVQADLEEKYITGLAASAFNPSGDAITSVGHGLVDGTQIRFVLSGTITGLTTNTRYWVRDATADTFKVSASSGGSAVNITGTPTGTADIYIQRATVTMTDTEMFGDGREDTGPAASKYKYTQCIIPFVWGAPYAVDTTASKWRIGFVHSGGTAGTWGLTTSDGTNPFYVAWCDNQVTAADNDVLIVKDKVIIDKSFTISGLLGTGTTDVATAGVICRNTDFTAANVALLEWENAPASAYTFTIKGSLFLGYHSGFRVGTAASPIPAAQAATIYFDTAPSGTITQSWIRSFEGRSSSSYVRNGASIFLYGEIPAVAKTTLSAQANTGQAVISLTDTPTGWQNGDTLVIGKQDVAGQGSVLTHAIQSISSNDVTLTANLATANRLAGGPVVNFNNYGIKLQAVSNANYGTFYMFCPSHFQAKGVSLLDCRFYIVISTYYYVRDRAAYRSQYTIQDCAGRSTSTSMGAVIQGLFSPVDGALVERVYAHRAAACAAIAGYSNSSLKSGRVTVDSCATLSQYSTSNLAPAAGARVTCQNCFFSNNAYALVTLSGLEMVFNNNEMWGSSGAAASSYGGVLVNQLVNPSEISGNKIDKCNVGVNFAAFPTLRCLDKNTQFGQTAANTTDIYVQAGANVDYEFNSPTGTLTIDTTNLLDTVEGTHLKFSDYNDTANDDRGYLTFGEFQRTGDGLTDTTVRTSGTGKFAIRFLPYSPADPLYWTFPVPTGNIQNKTMTVTVWVKINHANFYAAEHIKPTLLIDYDNGTEVSAVAAGNTDWQQLALTFTPTTTFPQITVILKGASDATGSESYFYADDWNIAYPAGVSVDLGGIDLWANAMPVLPPIATVPALGGVWDEAMSAHTVGGSYGVHAKQLLSTDEFIALK